MAIVEQVAIAAGALRAYPCIQGILYIPFILFILFILLEDF